MTSNPQNAGRRRKRPRVVAPPQHLRTAGPLTGSYAPIADEQLAQRAERNTFAAGSEASVSAHEQERDVLGGLRAKDDDPKAWGEKTEDLAEAMKREKPPHWG